MRWQVDRTYADFLGGEYPPLWDEADPPPADRADG